MASITKNELPPVKPQYTYTLTLSESEAFVIASILNYGTSGCRLSGDEATRYYDLCSLLEKTVGADSLSVLEKKSSSLILKKF